MNHLKDKKPTRPDIQEILSRMKSRFISGEDSDSEDRIKEENMVTTSVVESTVKEIPVEKCPDDEIAELMLKLNGQVDEELVASMKSRKKMYENHSEVDSTSSITAEYNQIEQEKPRIILTLRPNENKPDSYVSSSNLTDYSSNSPKRKKPTNNINTEVIKRSSRRSNDSNQSVLKSAIARKERTFSIGLDSKKRSPKKIKKEFDEVPNKVNVSTQPVVVNEVKDIKDENQLKDDESSSEQKKKKKKFFRGGRYNIFKKKTLQKERAKVKKSICNQLNAQSGNFEMESSETNSERHSISVCSDNGTLMSSDRNYEDDLDTSLSAIDVEDKVNNSATDVQDRDISLCLCDESIRVVLIDEGRILCKAEDCIDGLLVSCKRLAFHLDGYGHLPLLRASVALPFITFCEHHLNRFLLHQSCPRCGRFCSEGIFMMCKNKHFSHIGCHQKDKGCLHCGETDVYDLELKRIVVKHSTKLSFQEKCPPIITVEVGHIKLTNYKCPPEIDVDVLSKYLQQFKDELNHPKRVMYSVLGLYQACESNDIKRVLSIIGAECYLEYLFPNYNNRTALHAACKKGNLMIVYLLLQAGVDPNIVDDKMKSPMRMAAKFGHSQVVQSLINFNGMAEIKDVHGMTSLHLAAKYGKLDCCKVILNTRPAMVNWIDNGGWTPLVWACENSHVEVVKYFISLKPNTRIPDGEDNVALHWAAISGCLDVVKCLVEYDSEVNMFNDAGDTALHIAARKNATDIVSFLLEKGAMAWHKNKGKKKPIDCCIPSTKCHSLLKNIAPKQRKSVSIIQPLIIVDSKCANQESELTGVPVVVKTTPVLVSEDITHGCEDVPIRCVNEIDDELPIDFTYIKENCYDVGNHVDSAMSHIASCNCEGACNTNACKCVLANGECLYDENGRLNSDFDYFNPSVILYECNLRCKCHKQRCGNRVIQKGIKVELELYRHKDMGWGVRSRHGIPRGTFVCEYVGEIITDQKANDLKEDSYLFNLENPGATELYCIDAYNYSNISRFINHSCDPNLMSVRSFINHHDKRFPRIAFFAVQDIKENEQLCYDYGTTFWKIKGGLFTCKCGKSNCSFSDETIKNIHIDSDNEEPELGGNTEPSDLHQNKLFNDESPYQDRKVENKVDSSNLLHYKTKVSQDISSLESIKKHIIPINSEKSLITMNCLEKNYSKASLSKSKVIRVVKTKSPIKSVSKQLLKRAISNLSTDLNSKQIENKLQQVIVKKRLGDKILNGNSSLSNSKKMSVTKHKTVAKSLEKDIILNGKKVPLESVEPINSTTVTTYILRPKMSSPKKKIVENIITENSISNNAFFKSVDLRNKRANHGLSDTLSINHSTVRDLNDCSQSTDFSRTDSVSEESETNSSIVNGYSAKYLETSCSSVGEECSKIKSCEPLNIKNNFNKVRIVRTNSIE